MYMQHARNYVCTCKMQGTTYVHATCKDLRTYMQHARNYVCTCNMQGSMFVQTTCKDLRTYIHTYVHTMSCPSPEEATATHYVRLYMQHVRNYVCTYMQQARNSICTSNMQGPTYIHTYVHTMSCPSPEEATATHYVCLYKQHARTYVRTYICTHNVLSLP